MMCLWMITKSHKTKKDVTLVGYLFHIFDERLEIIKKLHSCLV